MITITVDGPGGTVSYEMIIVQRALEQVGLEVEVQDSSPLRCRGDDTETEDEFVERITNLIKSGESKINRKVRLVANHRPWSG